MTSATLGSSAIQYSYDATGNPTAKVISGTSYPNTIASTSNKLTQTQDVLGTATIQHDAAGNITSDGTNSYTYSDRGRLATMTNAGGTVTYSYNALEQRVAKTGPTALVPTGATYYVYDEAGKLLGEYDANGVPQYETIYLNSPVGVMVQTGNAANSNIAVSLYNVSTDQVGAPRVITRSSDEAIVWRWDSVEAFGATAPDQNPSNLGTFSFNQRLPGQVFDAESGLFQNWHREYNPRVGRYMQSDPIGLDDGPNGYLYVGGDPLRVVDPLGLFGMADMPLLPQGVVDAAAGLGDGVSLGITAAIRQGLGLNEQVNFCSYEYLGGYATGFAITVVGFTRGAELRIGNNFRLAPWGNRTGHPLGERPHYHRRGSPGPDGKTPPGQGIGKHRPWEGGF